MSYVILHLNFYESTLTENNIFLMLLNYFDLFSSKFEHIFNI